MTSPSSALTHRDIRVAFEAHRDELFGFFLNRTGCEATSDDLVQDTFLRALRSRGSFRGSGPVRGWLYTIARTRLASHGGQVAPTAAPLDADLADPGPDPWQATERALDIERVRAALSAVAPRHADVLVLTRIQGMPYAEAAEVLRTTEGAIKVRVFRALAALKQTLLDDDIPSISPDGAP